MRRLQIAAATLLAVVAIPATAGAKNSPYTDLLSIYTATGGINACQFTSSQLNGALKTIDVYGQAYFPDFANAIQAALVTRASGGCSTAGAGGAGGAGGARGAVGAGGGSSGLTPGPVTAATDAPIPAPIVILAVLVAAILALAAVVAITRARGWDPRWAAAARHSLSEAGYRLGGIWEEFVDRD